jgi:1,4-alpha-glucan branching enzyme
MLAGFMPRALFLLVLAAWSAAPLRAQAPELGATIERSGDAVTGVTFRVWAPNALGLAVAGDSTIGTQRPTP